MIEKALRPEPLAHSIPNAGARIGVSSRQVYKLIAQGKLRSFKVGRRRLITDAECQRLIGQQMAVAA